LPWRAYGVTASSLLKGPGFVYMPPHPLLAYIANYTVTCPSHGAMTDDYTVLPTASATLSYSIDSSAITGGLRGIDTKAAASARMRTDKQYTKYPSERGENHEENCGDDRAVFIPSSISILWNK
jgi:hypothetical protein